MRAAIHLFLAASLFLAGMGFGAIDRDVRTKAEHARMLAAERKLAELGKLYK